MWLMSWLVFVLPLTISVYGRIVPKGGDVRVTCRVQPHPDNRWLDMGVTNYRVSGRQLDGASAPITYEAWFTRIPCEAEAAFCAVVDSRGRVRMVRQSLTVVGC